MSAIYDNWERLVAAVLKKQQLWQLFHDHSRSPSIISDLSSSSFNSSSPLDDFPRSHIHSSPIPKLVFVSDFTPAIDVHLESTELLGTGTFGAAHTAKMHDGSRIVVKRLNSTAGISENDFNRQMAIVGGVRHENVAALRAYYSSGDERLMLYDYFNRGSVYDLLHGRHNGDHKAHVDWESRLRIAIGVARGVSEIHKHGNLAHGNIKTSNVFHDPDRYGWVSDLGPTYLIETTFPPNAHCYAPEVESSKNVLQASDVYSFGILLLELLTRKPTVYVHGGPLAVDLVKLVTSIMNRVRAANVFDADLLKDPTLKEQMVKMLQIGIKCVAKSIKKRPKMSEVVKMLQGINVLRPRTLSASRLVFIKDANPSFEIEDVLRGSAEVLGKGTFGTSYKTILKNGNTIMVKRLNDVTITLEGFRHQIEVIGKMSHENIAEVRAYFFSNDEKLLVYDYFNQDLSTLIHGHMRAARTPLDWETRLKIAVGAARGISHIHKQDDQKFVHGNIKSSNIFLSGQKYGIVSHAGLGKLTSSMEPWMSVPYAPEVSNTRSVSQASDVFGFGVVLLELLSRKSPEFSGHADFTSLVEWAQAFNREGWITEVFDSDLLRTEVEEEAMLQIILIAMDCVSVFPEHRPQMSHLVGRLEEITGLEPLQELRLEDEWGQPSSIESRLEDLLDDMVVVMTTQ